MGCCLVAAVGLFVPRITLFFVWIFTDYVSRAFQSFIWPLLGLFFMPYTTLAYSLVFVPGVGVAGMRWFWVALGIFLDVCSWGGGASSSSKHKD